MSEKTKAQLLAELKATKEALKGAQNEAEAYKEVVERVSSDLLNQGAELKKVKIELENAKRANANLWKENSGLAQYNRDLDKVNKDQAQEIKDLHEGIERVQKECEGHKTMVTMLKAEKLSEEYEKRRAIADANLWETRYCKKSVWDCIEDWWHSL